MYNRHLIGKTIQEAIAYIEKSGEAYTITRDIFSTDWDSELVVRVDYTGAYYLTTSGFKLHIKDVNND